MKQIFFFVFLFSFLIVGASTVHAQVCGNNQPFERGNCVGIGACLGSEILANDLSCPSSVPICCSGETGFPSGGSNDCDERGGACLPSAQACTSSAPGSGVALGQFEQCGGGVCCVPLSEDYTPTEPTPSGPGPGGDGVSTQYGEGTCANADGFCIPSGSVLNLSESSLTDIIIGVMLFLLYIVGFIAIIAFVISGIMYLTSAGNEQQATKAKQYMLYSIVGIIVALSGLIIIGAVQRFLLGIDRL